MSVRYGVELVFAPAFTARVYRARQLVCGQFGCWAAEMHLLRMTLAPYFPVPEGRMENLSAELAAAAAASRQFSPAFAVVRGGVAAAPETGSVFLEFADGNEALLALQSAAQSAAAKADGVVNLPAAAEFRPRIALLEYGGLPAPILADAAEFAGAVAADLQLPPLTRAWRLLLVRYESAAAGGDWVGGRWAADVSWRQLQSWPL